MTYTPFASDIINISWSKNPKPNFSRVFFCSTTCDRRFPPLRPNMQAMPDSRQQTFEEIYGPPENFLEVEVGLSISYPILGSRYSTMAELKAYIMFVSKGQEPPDSWHVTKHVHRLRSSLPNEYSRLQAQTFHCSTALFRLRVFPRHIGAGICPSYHTTSAGKSFHKSVQR